MSIYRSRPRAAATHIHDVGDVHFRGGQCWAIDGDTITVKVLIEASRVETRDVDVSLFEAVPVIGDPIILRIVGADATTGTVTHAKHGRPTFWGPHEQAESVERGEFHAAVLNGFISGVSVYQDGTNSVFQNGTDSTVDFG